ncbi:MAG: asparagine synthase (glutamine-hydrolyzing) [Polyangiaceae bacterium]|jgi:asparagine synthase (glutamine-hydrolysing)|nr:asparagine synthase (glutamine-hydrolyzing) [Polyangiaceae bacterium]
MCGITGFARLDLREPAALELASAMAEAMAWRGPDGGGTTFDPAATLAMKRLAIVDVQGGQQPMLSDDGMVALVFNGEIYNAPALRRSMRSEGVHFRSRSDTEVILRLYERDPDSVERHLAGMWAFAVHDRRRGRLVLSRDRFGIKPLFVVEAGGGLAFASDVRCFRPLVAARPVFARALRPDPGAAHAMLAWGYVPDERTIYQGVTRLAPGARLWLELGSGEVRRVRHWSLEPSAEAARVRTLGEACELVEPLLRRAVREHLESDVPVATFLSGGIDSSLVSAYARDASGAGLEAYSVGFRERAFDESSAARETALALDVTHTVGVVDEASARARLADALLAFDEPFGDDSLIATYLVADLAAHRHKVVFGGDGGDEVFAGYRKHRIVALRGALGVAGGAVGAALGRLPGGADRSGRYASALRTLGRVRRGLEGSDAEGYAALTQLVSLEVAAPLAAAPDRPEPWLAPTLARFRAAPGSALQKTLASDLEGPLPNDMLTKVDRATMARGLEARVPFLDHRLVEAGLGLPRATTLGTRGKAVLRELAERRFGPALARRPKRGFDVPVEAWLRGPLEPACEALFRADRLARDGLLSPDALAGGRWRAWARTQPQLLWHAFALAAWAEATLGGGPDALRDVLKPRNP